MQILLRPTFDSTTVFDGMAPTRTRGRVNFGHQCRPLQPHPVPLTDGANLSSVSFPKTLTFHTATFDAIRYWVVAFGVISAGLSLSTWQFSRISPVLRFQGVNLASVSFQNLDLSAWHEQMCALTIAGLMEGVDFSGTSKCCWLTLQLRMAGGLIASVSLYEYRYKARRFHGIWWSSTPTPRSWEPIFRHQCRPLQPPGAIIVG